MTNQNESAQDTQEKLLTPEEIEALKKQMISNYKDEIEVLVVQKEYETLLAEIEEARTRRMGAILRQAQMTNIPKDNQPAPKADRPGTAEPENKQEVKRPLRQPSPQKEQTS